MKQTKKQRVGWVIGIGVMTLCAALSMMGPSHADSYKLVHFSTGTGFYINQDGDVLTNAHVVDRCEGATVHMGGMSVPAEIVWTHAKHDVALLRTQETAPASAIFRAADLPMQEGDTVVVVGHPGGEDLTTRAATFIANDGPLGQPELLRFSDSVFQGNSGGPLLDGSGQVIGMVMAKSTTYRFNEGSARSEVIANADVAIQPAVLETLLREHGVGLRYGRSDAVYEAHRVEDRAREFVVQIRCQLPE